MRTTFSSSQDPGDRAALRLAQLAAAIEAAAPVDAGDQDDAPAARPVLPVAGRDDDEPGEIPLLPEPGRHASRRREPDLRSAVRARWPATAALGSQHLTLLAVGAAVVIAATAWWLLRGQGGVTPAPVATAASPLVQAAAAPSDVTGGGPLDAASGPSGAAGGRVTVDVVGKVRHPGIAVLDAGARVVDALRAAGGPRRGVDLSTLNLARVLVDGEQIAVGIGGAGGVPGAAAASGSAGSGGSGGSAGSAGGAGPPGGLVNLNTASESQLEGLPDVGPVTAQAILAYRQQNGGFTSVDQLLDVQGIGPKTLAQLTPYVTV
jgi:competence protein ComEA